MAWLISSHLWGPVGLSTVNGNRGREGPYLGRVALRLPVAGGVAQLVERLGRIEEARGSIPLTSTRIPAENPI